LKIRNDEEKFELAVLEFELDNYMRAKILVEDLLMNGNKKYEYYVLLGDIYFKLNNFVTAKENYEKAKAYAPIALVLIRLISVII
jgi:Tfp pilus assembly protein PilF